MNVSYLQKQAYFYQKTLVNIELCSYHYFNSFFDPRI